MAVLENTPLNAYTATGASAVFAYDFPVLDAADMAVLVNGSAPTSFVVSGAGNPAGGTVTITPTPSAGQRVVLFRDSEVSRSTDYQSNGDLLAAVVNRDFDRLWLVLQEVLFGTKAPVAAVRAPAGESLSELSAAASRASKLLGFDSSGQPIAVVPTSGDASALALQLAATDDANEGAGQVGYGGAAITYPADSIGEKAQRRYEPEEDGAVADNSTDNQSALVAALAQTKEVHLLPGAYRVGSGNLDPSAKTRISGSGRELTFVRTTHASNPVFSSDSQFVTYEHMTIDRTSGVVGQGVNHTGASNVAPLEGFVLRHCNVNGHATGVRLRDFVLAAIEYSYIQACETAIDINNTGSNANTMLTMRHCWVRANTTVGMTATSVINAHIDQVAFEASGVPAPLGLNVGGGGSWLLTQTWWEALQQCAAFTNVSNVDFYGGYVDGSGLTTTAFYFNGATTAFTVTFDGPWFFQSMSGKTFATADQGVTIYVRSPQLATLTFVAVNGGKVIYDYDIVAAAAYNPGNIASNATETTTVTVAGASTGDLVEVFFDNGTTDPRLFLLTAIVTAPDTVGVMFRNLHTSAVDMASGTLTVKVRKKPLVS